MKPIDNLLFLRGGKARFFGKILFDTEFEKRQIVLMEMVSIGDFFKNRRPRPCRVVAENYLVDRFHFLCVLVFLITGRGMRLIGTRQNDPGGWGKLQHLLYE